MTQGIASSLLTFKSKKADNFRMSGILINGDFSAIVTADMLVNHVITFDFARNDFH